MKTREKILHTMYKLMAINGYEKTSISMICENLNIKKPSIYYYFKSKEEIFITIFEEIIMDKVSLAFEKNISKENYKDRLIKIGQEIIQLYENDTELIAVVMELYVQSQRIIAIRDKIKVYDVEFKKYIEAIVKLGIELGVFPKEYDVNLNTEILCNTLQGIEFSIVFGLRINNNIVWEKIINRMFMELEM